MKKYEFVPLSSYREYPVKEMEERAAAFYADMKRRRSVRDFSNRPVPREIIENCIRAAGTAPSGANMQPWRFVVVSDPQVKKEIREAAEKIESDFYKQRASESALNVLAPLGTDQNKQFLEEAPYLIVIFKCRPEVGPGGTVKEHYYFAESVGIATGMLMTAVHNAGLVCLTHTPAPLTFVRDILQRPPNEMPYMILVVGYPKKGTKVPVIAKKSLDEIAIFM
ncbi:MAG: nitroreductase family protein [candidate division Zixibacteria bacterium]|nr:nitroreductase family protein [candidate division Zixibacteria bacterium]